MNSRQKTFIVIGCLLIVVIALLYFFFSVKKAPSLPLSGECALYQSTDATKPCFVASTAAPIPKKEVVVDTPENKTSVTLSPREETVRATCISPDPSLTDACIKKAAVTTKSISLCSTIANTLDRVDCMGSLGRVEKPTAEVFSKPSSEPVFVKPETVATTTTARRSISSIFSDMLNAMKKAGDDTRANPDSRYTADGFLQRFAEHNGVTLYAFSEYQVAPGTIITAQGVGFTKTGNTLYLGSYSISGLESTDGTTLTFTVPGINNGTYEGWVENEKGTSKKDTQKIYLVITNSPSPRPVIRTVSPQNPSAGDTVTFSGENLGSSVTVITSFGSKENIPSSGNSFSLTLSQLPYFDKVKGSPLVTGSKVSFFVQIQNENGTSRQPFTFDIQF